MTDKIKQILVLLTTAILLLGLAYYKFLYEPGQLKQHVRDQSVVIGTVQQSNKNLKEGIQFSKDAEVLKDSIVDTGEKAKEENAVNKSTKQAKIETKVETIEADFNQQIEKSTEPAKTATLIKAREKAISKTRIDALWKDYCQNEPSDLDCRGYK